ncbi:pilus assembly protein TadG-related protein [Hydrogenophaga sp.]|uniref:pilus assembly protein TadG-related protein n=1 Tax=Hydrogenophaga sp. TaxID=1904254 RepID=UPI003561BBD8
MKYPLTATPPMGRRAHPTRLAQRGSILINAAVALSLAVVLLVGLDLGYLFYLKRDMQKTADLSSLAAAPHVQPNDCTAAEAAALSNASLNLSGFTPVAGCGNWNPAHAGPSHFVAGQTPFNAVRVGFLVTPPPLLPMPTIARTIGVEAVAAIDSPVAAFSVGSRLLRLQSDSLLPSMLKTLGVGLSDTDILSYQGLKNASITGAGLLAALNVPVSADIDVGTLNALAVVRDLTLGNLLNATLVSLQSQGPTVLGQVLLLEHLTQHLNSDTLNTRIPLFGTTNLAGILVGLDDTGIAALDARVDVLSLVSTSLAVANGSHFIDMPALSVPLLGVAVKVTVVEPPTIGIGGVGTIARTAQIRSYVRVNSNGVPLLGAVLDLFGTSLDLPIIVELAQSSGELTAIDCQSPRQNATIAVSSSAVNLCMGRFHDMTSDSDNNNAHFFSANNRCAPDSSGQVPDAADGVRRHKVLNVLGQLPLGARVGLPLLPAPSVVSTGSLNEPSDPPDGTHQATVGAAPLSFNQAASNLADAVTVGILGDVLGQGVAASYAQRDALATSLVGNGNGGRGRSITEVHQGLQDSADLLVPLSQRINSGGLSGLLGGVLNSVGGLLDSVLLDPLADISCNLALLPSGVRACRVAHIRDHTLANGNKLLGASLDMVIALIDPALSSLSAVFENLLNTLGLSLGETDVEVLSVSCGRPKLVY